MSLIYASAYQQVGAAQIERGNTQAAIQSLETALRLIPDDPLTHYNLGIAYQDAELYPEAIAQYRRAIELDPVFADAYYNLGVSLFTNAEQQAQTSEPDEDDLIAVQAYNARNFTRYGLAIETLQEAIELFNDAGDFAKADEVESFIQNTIEPALPVPAEPRIEDEGEIIPTNPASEEFEPFPVSEPEEEQPQFPAFPESNPDSELQEFPIYDSPLT
ncbi:MAG: tetratricopeptide repeat protein [Spirulina sp. SIO3F2]|nr:tetratricopeptide repeat protein [Spirulina sp. SIO3F2]